MRYFVLACDYDGTIAHEGVLSNRVISSLEKLIANKRQLILVTGRTLEELLEVCSRIDLFKIVVCENGGLLFKPDTQEIITLASELPPEFVRELEKKHITPLTVGRTIAATWHPNEKRVLEIIRELGLDLQISFNKGAVMITSSSVNKATGLRFALETLRLSLRNTVGVGDAENDHAFLDECELSVAVNNALDSLKQHVDYVMNQENGQGVIELIDQLIANDLSLSHSSRQSIVFGTTISGESLRLAFGESILITGDSNSGKTTLSFALVNALAKMGYQICVIDPEGEYDDLWHSVTTGNQNHEPDLDDVMRVLENPNENCVVNLLGVSLANRPDFLTGLVGRLQQIRERLGRPHWIVIDEAHHMLHPYWEEVLKDIPDGMNNVVLITVNSSEISRRLLESSSLVVALGKQANSLINSYCEVLGVMVPKLNEISVDRAEALVWKPKSNREPEKVRLKIEIIPIKRHRRKYADGDVGKERSFYFTGPRGLINLRAKNLYIFLEIMEGIDDETWQFHLNRGDYANWFREVIRDVELAENVNKIEPSLSAVDSKRMIKELIERRYTLPYCISRPPV